MLTYSVCHHEFTTGRMNSEWAVVSIVCLLFLSKPLKTKPQNLESEFCHFLLVYCSLMHHYSGLDVAVLYRSVVNVLSVPCITVIIFSIIGSYIC